MDDKEKVTIKRIGKRTFFIVTPYIYLLIYNACSSTFNAMQIDNRLNEKVSWCKYKTHLNACVY
jgi:hypothetical protein